MRTHFRTIRHFELPAIALVSIVFILVVFVIPPRPLTALRNACASGDRIVVDINPFPMDMRTASHLSSSGTYEIRGQEAVAAFLDVIEFRSDENRHGCKCVGDLLITINGGATELAAISIHHDKYLRWRDGPWSGDQPLTASSFNALSAFLTAHKCPTPREAKVAFGDLMAKQAQAQTSEP